MQNNKVELLAPCGDKNTFLVALNSGADAIYLGAKDFNARKKANNFTNQEIRECVKQAHLFGVKVYLTLNILIKNDEFDKIEKIVDEALDANIDAFIIQDLGLAYYLKNRYKNIVLHASTQMGVCNVEGAKLIEKMGFSRVVLSREVKLEDIIRIKKETKLEIEYFVQGALCVSFSGNCYLSSVTKNQSGNRGECLQLCRLPYNVAGKDGYFMSTTDLCLIERINELINAGVDSFKIEGRLRRAGYIAQAVQSYRSVLDGLSNPQKEKQKLFSIFERGTFNEGYHLDGYNDPRIINSAYQNHRGKIIGNVLKVERFKDLYEIHITSTHKIASGDGVKFLTTDKSMGVGNVYKIDKNLYKVFSKTKPEIGENVSLMVDNEYENLLCSKKRKIPIDIAVIAKQGQLPQVHMACSGVEVVATLDEVCPGALTKPTSQQEIVDSITKLGNTPYEIDHCMVINNDIFLAKSQINELRRRGIDKLTTNILQKNTPKQVIKQDFALSDIQSTKINAIIVDSLDNVPKGQAIIYAPTIYNESIIEKVNQLAQYQKIYLQVPVCSSEEFDVIKNIILKLDKQVGILANNISGLTFDREIIANYTLNIVNDYSLAFINSLGITMFVNSIEPIFSEYNKGMNYSGNGALMLFTHCPYKTIMYNSCKSCMANNPLVYNRKHTLRRYVIRGCYFELCAKIGNNAEIVDVRK